MKRGFIYYCMNINRIVGLSIVINLHIGAWFLEFWMFFFIVNFDLLWVKTPLGVSILKINLFYWIKTASQFFNHKHLCTFAKELFSNIKSMIYNKWISLYEAHLKCILNLFI